jgi:dephospho-CoA kinase
MLRVGLTGGIACGKSRVLRRLASHGFHAIDLDAVARDVTSAGSPGLGEIEEAFGPVVLTATGGLDRSALAARVFARPEELARLNAIVHPRVRAEEARWAAAFAGETDAVLVTDGALIVESGAHLRFDRLIVVDCDPARQLARLCERDGLDEASARARIEAQMPGQEKRRFGHFVIDTSGSLEETDAASDAVAEELSAEAKRRRAAGQPSFPALLGMLEHGPRSGPRGLSPAAVLESIGEHGGLELAALARQLDPPSGGVWYRAAVDAPPGAPAALLAVAVVAWALSRGAPDPAFLAAAASSLARLTHTEAPDRTDACLVALVLQDLATSPDPPRALAPATAAHVRRAELWGGASPSRRLESVWSAVRRHPSDPAGAAAACRAMGGEPALAAALAGAAAGAGQKEGSAWEQTLAKLGVRA